MNIKVLDLKGKKIEDLILNEKVFGIEPNEEVLKVYVRAYLFNQRQGNASAKTRAEVSGSGRKPWAQKGTGRARAGDKRSPVWTKGGISHGPKPKDWSLQINKKVKKLAMKSALSNKFNMDKALVIESLKFDKPKTSEMLKIINDLKIKKSALFVLDSVNQNIIKSSSNIKKVKTSFVDNLNPYELLNTDIVIFTKSSIKKLEERYKK